MLKISHGPSLKVLLNCNFPIFCDLFAISKKGKRSTHQVTQFSAYFQAIFKKKVLAPDTTVSFSALQRLRGKRRYNRANATFLTQIFNFPNGSVAHRKMLLWLTAEVESSRTSLTSRTHFEVLGLEASSSRKLACPRLEDSTIF